MISCEWHNRAVTDADGTVQSIFSKFQDVTERENRKSELEEYETIINALTDAVYVLNEAGRFTYVNDEFVELVGYDRETILGNTPSLVKDATAVEQAEHQLGRLLSSEGPDTVSFDVTIQPRDGDPIVCEDHMGVLPYDGDQFDGSVGTLRDITDRKEREQELQRTRGLMADMEQLANAGAWEYDSKTERLMLTDGAYRLYGRSPETDLTLAEAFDAIHPDDRGRLRDQFDTCLETGEPCEIEIRLTTPDGRQRWITTRVKRVTADGNSNVVRGYTRDITEQRSRERNLERYQTALNELPDPVVVYDEDGQYEIVNQAAAEVRDAPREELTGTKSRYLEQIQEEASAEYSALLEGKRDSLRVELTAEFSGPVTRTFECRFSRITETADPNDVVMTTRDVTDRNERERKLKRERERYATLFETLPTPVLHARAEDGEPIVETVNPAFEDTFGYDTETIRNEPIQEYVLPDDRDDATRQLNRRILREGEVQTEVQRETTDGVRTFQLNVRTNDTDGESVEGYAVYTDITEQKAQNERLEEFTSVVSHDLQSPLTVAEDRLEVAQETCESPHLDQAADAIDRSQALIEDLLTLVREGDDVSEVEPVAIADAAESSWATVESPSATLETHATRTLQADQSRLKQLFENLYRNAIEHGGDGVTVSVGPIDGGFYVADTGPGIPEDDREEVFEAGYSTNEEGTGFGLRIVTQVADAHGWEIAVTESEQGGARFEVTGVEFADQ